MKLMQFKYTAVLMLAAFSIPAHADCAYPKPPASIPNGATATEAEMVSAISAFKAYDADVKAFGACLDEEIKNRAGSAQMMQLKTMQSKKLNAAVDELQAKAKEFNAQVRAFKARG